MREQKALIHFLQSLAEKLGVYPDWLKQAEIPIFNYSVHGTSGPIILLLHGLFGHLSNWDGVIPKLEKECQLIALEFPILRGTKSEVSVKSLALYVICFLLVKNLNSVYLCGNSLGGHVAIRTALLVPDMIKGLILAGPSGLYENSIDTLPIKPDKEFIRRHMKRVFYDPSLVTDKYVDEIYTILSDKDNVKRLLVAAKSAKRDYLLNELPLVKPPTLLIWGREDEITTLEVGQVFASKIPKHKLVVREKCGHAPMMEAPSWFAEEVLKFVMHNE